MEECSESGSGHSNRLPWFEAIFWANNVVSRGQGPKQRFSWQEAMALELAPGSRELTVSSLLVSRVSCLVSSCLFGMEKKKRRWKGNKAIPKGKYRR